jgi:spermidine synthase
MRTVAILLTALTGFSGLVYEIAWQKYLQTLLGSHSEATAAVLGIFLGGLSLGYLLFGAVTRRVLRAGGSGAELLLMYGVVECAIGVHAFLFPQLFSLVTEASIRVPDLAAGAAFSFDVVLTALLIGPATVLMGGTIPVLTQALASSLRDATRIHALIYATNTAGAFAGALAAGYVLIPYYGVQLVVLAMGVVNLSAGIVFGVLGALRRKRPLGSSVPENRVAPVQSAGVYAAVACLIGFAAMTLQTVVVRIGGLALGSSEYTFSTVVAVFVLCIALGSFAVSALPRIRPVYLVGSVWGLALVLVLLYTQADQAPYWAHVLRTHFEHPDSDFYPYYLAVFAAALALLGIPVGLSGAALPLLFHRLRQEHGELGAVAGRLYASNTFGSLAGALVGGYLLLFWLDLHHVFRVAVGAVALAGALLVWQPGGSSRFRAAGLGAAAVVAIALLPPWDPRLLSSGLFRVREATLGSQFGVEFFLRKNYRTTEVIFYDDDPTTSVAVRERALGGAAANRSIVINGKPDGSVRTDYQTMALSALLPALLADRCERAFVIGWGTGVTAGELGALDCSREIVVAEISRGVLAAAPLFDYGNQRASLNPKLHAVNSDAYRALLRADDEYDLIISEPSNPWVAGIEVLYSREFFEAARERLRPGGVHAQWIHLYETDRSVVELILDTYASVFEHVAVWFTQGADLVLIGFDRSDPGLDLERIEAGMQRREFAVAFRRAGIESLLALLSHEVLPVGVLHAARPPPRVHTLFHPLLGHLAGRAFFAGKRITLPPLLGTEAERVGRDNSLLRRYLARFGEEVPEEVWSEVTREVCRWRRVQCAALLADWEREKPQSAARLALLAELDGNKIGGVPFDASLIGELAPLLEAEARGPSESGVTPERAERSTRLFVDYYHHAAPFSRAALAGIWSRCRDAGPDAGACRSGRLRAEGALGPLE